MNTESWCTVEKTSSQDWTRAQRTHYNHAFESSVFSELQRQGHNLARVDFQTDISNIPHKEKRHFSQDSSCNLKGASFTK